MLLTLLRNVINVTYDFHFSSSLLFRLTVSHDCIKAFRQRFYLCYLIFGHLKNGKTKESCVVTGGMNYFMQHAIVLYGPLQRVPSNDQDFPP